MNTADLLQELTHTGIKLAVVGGDLDITAPPDLLTDARLQAIKQRKGELLALLAPVPTQPLSDKKARHYRFLMGNWDVLSDAERAEARRLFRRAHGFAMSDERQQLETSMAMPWPAWESAQQRQRIQRQAIAAGVDVEIHRVNISDGSDVVVDL